MDLFVVKDCSLLMRMSGLPPAFNLRELRDRLSVCSSDVLYHHFCETPLVPSFDYPDHRNDFAVWASRRLGDKILAEQLGAVDPYAIESMETLRKAVLDIIDERLNDVPTVPWARPGFEFYFMQATTVVFDTGERLGDPWLLSRAVERMSNGSIYFHFLEARRRPPLGVDDFSIWLEGFGEDWAPSIKALKEIDFYFSSLPELRRDLVRIFSGPLHP